MGELLNGWKRTCYCTELTESDVGREVTLMGWANVRRDLGALIFVQLRDVRVSCRSCLTPVRFRRRIFRALRRYDRSMSSPCAGSSWPAPAQW